jgi:succinate-semialdehyde dehydrogenase/glutarate-semialdehyde dehydrogenase
VPYLSVNPATGEVLKTFTEHTNEQMLTALDAADKTFHTWSTTPIIYALEELTC